jgi:hypothetical protein
VQGTVKSIEEDILLVNGLYVRVPADATFLDMRNEGHVSVTFVVSMWAQVVYFGRAPPVWTTRLGVRSSIGSNRQPQKRRAGSNGLPLYVA